MSENNNLNIYEQCREVPANALKKIEAGTLKGKSDISPIWRIKKLTELFGPVGIGWYSEIVKEWIEHGANGEVIIFVRLKLYVKHEGEWSKGIEGTGGNKLINAFNKGLKSNDEALKMAETDALSVACKKLGIAADVYWEEDKTKYTNVGEDDKTTGAWKMSDGQRNRLFVKQKNAGVSDERLKKHIKEAYGIDSRNDLNKLQYDKLCNDLDKIAKKGQKAS